MKDVKQKHIIGTIYRPPAGSIENFFESIGNILSRTDSNVSRIVIGGDMNIDLKNNSNSAVTFLNTMLSSSLIPTINKASRETSVTSTLIDNIFPTTDEHIKMSGLFLTDISDHYPIFVISDIPKIIEEAPSIPRYNINRYTMAVFKQNIKRIKWEEVTKDNDAQKAFSNFHRHLVAEINNSFPLKQKSNRYSSKIPWMSQKL